MNTRSIIIATLLVFGSLLSYSQVVASIESSANFISTSTIVTSQVTFDVVPANQNATFEGIEYSSRSQKLALTTIELIQFITIIKDGAVFLKNMPVLSNKVNLSMNNYSSGDYELHLTIEGKGVPTIIELAKS